MKRLIPLLLALSVFAAEAGVHTGAFAGRTWSIAVPDGYTSQQPPTTPAELSTVLFAPDVREDGTRPMVQISLVQLPGDKPLDLGKMAGVMIASVQRRRDEWKVATSETTVDGMKAIRYEWSGVSIPADDGAKQRLPVRGVMLVAVSGTMVISLHTQDAVQYAEETLPRCEASLRTFRFVKD